MLGDAPGYRPYDPNTRIIMTNGTSPPEPLQAVDLAAYTKLVEMLARRNQSIEGSQLRLLRSMVESAPYPTYLLAPDFTVEQCSASFPELLSSSRDKILGLELMNLVNLFSRQVPDNYRPAFLLKQQQVIASGRMGAIPKPEWTILDNRGIGSASYAGLYFVGIYAAQFRGQDGEHSASLVCLDVLPMKPSELMEAEKTTLTRPPIASDPIHSSVVEDQMAQVKQSDKKTVSVELPTETASLLLERAEAAGQPLDVYLQQLAGLAVPGAAISPQVPSSEETTPANRWAAAAAAVKDLTDYDFDAYSDQRVFDAKHGMDHLK